MFVTKSFGFSFAILVFLTLATATLRAQETDGETLPNPIVALSDSGAFHAINQLPASIRSSMPFARQFYDFVLHADAAGNVDNAAYLHDFDEARQDMLLASAEAASRGKNTPQSTEGTWSNIGLTGADTVPSAGITTDIEFDPQNPNIMYAGGSGGGVWKSTDTGADWVNLTDNWLPNLSVASIAIDPVNTNTLYVGTGYCYSSVPEYNGSGLYQSTDGGQSFQRLTTPGTTEDFVKVIVDPSNHDVVLASSFDQAAVYRSTNAGQTWSTAFSSGLAWDLIATHSGSSTIFYLIAPQGVWSSANDGSTWTKLPTTNFPSSIGRCELASPANAPNYLYALMTDPGGSACYLYKSTNAGVTWDSLATPQPDIFTPYGHAQGWYDLYIAVTPNSGVNDTIYIAGINSAVGNGLNAGSWQLYSNSSTHSNGGGGLTHVDHHSFAINPLHPNIVYDGDDGGLWINYAAGSANIAESGGWQLHSLDMITSRFYNFGFDEANSKINWVGAQDQGLFEMMQGQAPVNFPVLGDAMQPLVSTENHNHIYAEGPVGEIYQFTVPTNNYQLTADTAEGVTDACGWQNPFRISPVSASVNGKIISGSNILYVGRAHLWQTSDGGTTWTKLSPSFGFVDGGLFYCTAIGLPNWNGNLIYVAGGGSSFQVSTNFGVSWTSKTNPASGFVTSINTTSQDTNFVLVTMSSNQGSGGMKKVLMSDDRGTTWTDVSGTAGAALPGADSNGACNVMSLAIDSTHPLTTWYVATDFGMYQTSDKGQHWSFMGPGLIPCRDVQIYTNKTTLQVATYGRGMWELTLPLTQGSVEMNSLSATKSSSGAELSWNVQDELAGANFYVERSIDGNGFSSVTTVAGKGATNGTNSYSFADNTTAPGTYLYRIHEIDASGSQEYSNQVELHFGTNQLYLYQPYPNPLILGGTNEVTLNFEIPVSDEVHLNIYSIDGKLIRSLLDRNMAGGPQSASWDARDNSGNLVAPGAYFYSVQTASSGMSSGKIMVVEE